MSESPRFQKDLQLLMTDDGTQTLLNSRLDSTYHSRHGAWTETQHVFIKSGLEMVLSQKCNEIVVLEMGFGTGLNALATALQVKDD
ncbi:MAG: hypothetical protein QF371_04625, partial [Flavobacteriales bacterium]|nr:hypothetical protein [Flavobacteriales bacterium]